MFERVYLDNAATTRLDPAVLKEMMPFLTDDYGNASSIHSFGQTARAAVDKARHRVAGLLNARPAEIVLTSGGTESNNLAIRGLVESIRRKHSDHKNERPHLIISAIEHPAVKMVCDDLAGADCEITVVTVDETGVVDHRRVTDSIRENTVLVSIMAVNNEIGTIQPIAEIGRSVRSLRDAGQRIWFHTDAVQAVGKMSVDVEELGCDLLSLSGHKIHGPKGIGALYVRRGVRLHPQNIGGRQERGNRGGTEPVSQIVGLGAAAEKSSSSLIETTDRLRKLRDGFEDRVLETIPEAYLNGDRHGRVPNISNISFRGIEGEGLLINLDMQGFAVSTGAACSSGSIEPSPVIIALGRDDELARGAIRFSFSRFTSNDEVERLLTALPRSVETLRSLSAGLARK
ncbi:MAG TPA: cysteine desulfurase family protein [Pyrinomonadaceae bacterium]|nr:cysteine desulfurase family protein [Pyrinomonadaceae bacterium]